jgi:hypothetical protein
LGADSQPVQVDLPTLAVVVALLLGGQAVVVKHTRVPFFSPSNVTTTRVLPGATARSWVQAPGELDPMRWVDFDELADRLHVEGS